MPYEEDVRFADFSRSSAEDETWCDVLWYNSESIDEGTTTEEGDSEWGGGGTFDRHPD